MLTHIKELKRASEFIADCGSDNRSWIHIRTADRLSAQRFIRQILADNTEEVNNILNLNLAHQPLERREDLIRVLKYITDGRHARHFEQFLERYPRRIQAMAKNFRDSDLSDMHNESGSGDHWALHFFKCFLFDYGKRRPLGIVLENLADTDRGPLRSILDMLISEPHLPVVVISSGADELAADIEDDQKLEIHLRKLSVREAENVVIDQLDTTEINARLITNHLFVKSRGDARTIKFMLRAFYEPFLPSDSEQLLDSKALTALKTAENPDSLFQRLVEELPEKTVDILSMLSRMEDPLPRVLFEALLKKEKLPRSSLEDWLSSDLINLVRHLDEDFVCIDWAPFKEFLRQNTSMERSRSALQALGQIIPGNSSEQPVVISNQFSNVEDLGLACQSAFQEAKALSERGAHHRALDRLGFIRRNFSRSESKAPSQLEVLQMLGELQKTCGLYENAFESFREWRELLPREERDQWSDVSLEMADVLLRMDALAEARYLIQELRIRESNSIRVKTYANILMGELEQNSGHAEYALKYYHIARADLHKVAEPGLTFRLYQILKDIHVGQDDRPAQEDLIAGFLAEATDDHSKAFFQMESVRFYMAEGQFDAALPIAVNLYRRHEGIHSPAAAHQIRLYLAELYAYFGKWYLSRSHLQNLLSTGLLIPGPRTRLHLLLSLGIVEKEIGHYRAALDHLQEAQRLARDHHAVRESYQCRIHIGHTYLLIHNPIRAREQLLDTLEWAENSDDDELKIPAALFLSSYELHRKRVKAAGKYLEQARVGIELGGTRIDRLNYAYYFAQFKVAEDELDVALETTLAWQADSKGIIKYENMSLWLLGRIHGLRESYEQAEEALMDVLARSRRYRTPHLEFQVCKELTMIAHRRGNMEAFVRWSGAADQTFQKLAETIDDEILQRQLQESNEYEEFRKLR